MEILIGKKPAPSFPKLPVQSPGRSPGSAKKCLVLFLLPTYFSFMRFLCEPAMPPPIRLLLFLGLALTLGCGLGLADPIADKAPATPARDSAPAPAAGIDQKAIHEEYVNGDFEN